MATIVLVHGIAQEQLGAASLEQHWLPALADGLRAGGHPQIAARIWPPEQPGGITARMAYYGNLFLTPGSMGTSGDPVAATGTQQEIADRLAAEWVTRAAERDNPDQRAAAAQLSYLHPGGHHEQGSVREAQRSALNGLTKLRWFASFGMAVAGKFVNTALRQVTQYLSNHDIRSQVQDRVGAHIDEDTQVLIGHSLGSVIAYEAAHQLTRPLPLLITLGSPLGLRSVVYDHVRPQPPTYPPQVQRWVNIADLNDLIAAEPDLGPMFADLPPRARFDGGWTVHNGAQPHDARFYLTKEQTGLPIGDTLAARLADS